MSGAIYKAGAGAILQQMRLDVYANNLANVNTSGFKADHPAFRFDLSEAMAQQPAKSEQLSPYALPLDCVINFESGPLQATGNPLDIAVVGEGFMEVQTPDGLRYTRNGHLRINEDGVLSTSHGWPVMGQGGDIGIKGGRIDIAENGEVSVDGDVVGVLRIVAFEDAAKLQKVGDAFFHAPDAGAGLRDAQDFHLTQGSVEGSNVNAIRTMTEIIDTLRIFETYQKAIPRHRGALQYG